MQYSVLHLKYHFEEAWQQDLFEQAMCDLGCEVFDGENAYIQTAILEENQADIQSLIAESDGVQLIDIEQCPDVNWNATWEAEHEIQELPLGVRITPHCAFGAGHHETTSMMINALLEARETPLFTHHAPCVLDMGCGTGVLAIMAKKCGANTVIAVDIDDKSVANTLENAADNNVTIDVCLASTPPDGTFDLILANIHRNILIDHMPAYAHALAKSGQIWLSGFYQEDIPHLLTAAETVGLKHIATHEQGEWRMLKLTHQS